MVFDEDVRSSTCKQQQILSLSIGNEQRELLQSPS